MLDDDLRGLGRELAGATSAPALDVLRVRARRRRIAYAGATALAATAVVATVSVAIGGATTVAPAPAPITAPSSDRNASADTNVIRTIEADTVIDAAGARLSSFAMLPSGERLALWQWCQNPHREGSCREATVLMDAEGHEVARTLLPEGQWYVVANADAFTLSRLGGSTYRVITPDGQVRRVEVGDPPLPLRGDEAVLRDGQGWVAVRTDEADGSSFPPPSPFDDTFSELEVDLDGRIWAGGTLRHQPSIAWSDDVGATWTSEVVGEIGGIGAYVVLGTDGRVAGMDAVDGAINPAPTELIVSLDDGATWTQVVDLPFDSMTGRAASPDGRLLVTDVEGQLWRSDSTWTRFERAPDAPKMLDIQSAGRYLFASPAIEQPGLVVLSPDPERMLVSDNAGRTWSFIDTR